MKLKSRKTMLFALINRIYLNKLSPLINRKDKRSIRNWCLQNHLKIHKDCSGEFIIEPEFELIYNAPIIKQLKEKHRDSWQDYYCAYEDGELHKLIDVSPKNKRPNYIPKGNVSPKIFDKK